MTVPVLPFITIALPRVGFTPCYLAMCVIFIYEVKTAPMNLIAALQH